MFDKDYWEATKKSRESSCTNCGYRITPLHQSSTGWTHTGDWEGIRCPGLLCGAEPVHR
jgi:hypothetical protein